MASTAEREGPADAPILTHNRLNGAVFSTGGSVRARRVTTSLR
jgi:hypothetical protein